MTAVGKATVIVHSNPRCGALGKGHVHQCCLHPGLPWLRVQMAENDICIWTKASYLFVAMAPQGLSSSVRHEAFVSAQGEVFALTSTKRPSRASAVCLGDLRRGIEVDLSPKFKISVIRQSPFSHLESQSLHLETQPTFLQLSMEKDLIFQGVMGIFDY